MKELGLLLVLGMFISFISCNQEPVSPTQQLSPTIEVIGSRNVELVNVGEGNRTFVFVHDIGADLDDWVRSNIAKELAATNQVIAYNRPGYGKSSFSQNPPTLISLAHELNKLIEKIANQDRVILIGHAWGATIARVFTVQYPEKVAGILMLDPIHEDQFEDDLNRALPSWYFANVNQASQAEIDAFNDNLLVLDTLGILPDKPVTLITAFGPVTSLERRFAAHKSLVVSLSPGGIKHYTLDQIGYQIHLESPTTVIEELFELSHKIR